MKPNSKWGPNQFQAREQMKPKYIFMERGLFGMSSEFKNEI